MKLLTEWLQWRDLGRGEDKFHCDLLLGPADWLELRTSDGRCHVIHAAGGRFIKVHVSMSWESRETEFVE